MITTRIPSSRTLSVGATLLLLLVACAEVDVGTGDPLWCDRQLCPAWTTLEGSVVAAPSWIEGDPAAQLVGTNVRLQGQVAYVPATRNLPWVVEILGDIETGAELEVGLDLYQTGAVGAWVKVPATRWDTVRIPFEAWEEPIFGGLPLPQGITLQLTNQDIRVMLRKQGSGEVVIYRVGLNTGSAATPPTPQVNRPLGAPCDQPEDCASGRCTATSPAQSVGNVCGGCDGITACGVGHVCGMERRTLLSTGGRYALACETPGNVGSACVDTSECSAGVCCQGLCQGCCSNADCGGSACENALTGNEAIDIPNVSFDLTLSTLVPTDDTHYPVGTFNVCARGQGIGGSGAVCTQNSDCASGLTCQGPPLTRCNDLVCATVPSVVAGACG